MRFVSRIISVFMALLLSLSPAMTSLAQAQAARDITPPKVLHEPDSGEVPSDQPYVVSATVSDENGVGNVTLFFRQVGSSIFNSVDMTPTGKADVFVTEINPAELNPPGLEYYIQAEDTSGNTLLRGFTFEPLVLKIGEGSSGSDQLASQSTDEVKKSGSSSSKWLWIGLGVLAVGGLAAGGGGGGGGGGNEDPSVTINAPIPQ